MRALILAVALALSACAPAPRSIVFGVGIARVDGQLLNPAVLGTTKDMAECRELAKKAYAQTPPTRTGSETAEIGCAEVEIQ